MPASTARARRCRSASCSEGIGFGSRFGIGAWGLTRRLSRKPFRPGGHPAAGEAAGREVQHQKRIGQGHSNHRGIAGGGTGIGTIAGPSYRRIRCSRSSGTTTACWSIQKGSISKPRRSFSCTIGIDLTAEQFKDISLRHGENAFALAVERGIQAAEISRLRAGRDRL